MALGAIAAVAIAAALIPRDAHTTSPATSPATGLAPLPPAAPGPAPRPIDPAIVPATIVGMNLGGTNNFEPSARLKDMVRNSGQLFIVTDHGWATDHAAFLPATFDGDGLLHGVPRGRQIGMAMYGGAHRLSGTFDCHISPGWRLGIFGDAAIEGSGTRFRIKVPPAPSGPGGALALTLQPTGVSADLTDLACLPQGDPDPENPFVPAYLHDLKPFPVIRFMDTMRTNSAAHRAWATRPTPRSLSFVGDDGWPVEYLVALANQAQADPWFTLPFDADPDYYRNFAIYVRDHLAPGRKAYIEYSNEVWNGAFPQGKAATQLGQAAYPGVDPTIANDYLYADRVRALMKIWTDVFAGQEKRLVRVASAQAAWPDRADHILGHEQTWRSVDMLATAPYFGTNGLEIPEGGQARIDGLFAAGPKIVGQAIDQAKAAKRIATRYGLRYGTYEGGPGFVNGAPSIQKDLSALEDDPRMYGLYTLFLDRWQKEVGGLLMLYTLLGSGSQYGYWGHINYTGQPFSEKPKARAVIDFIDRLPAQRPSR